MNANTYGQRLREYRTYKGLSQSQLAHQSGVAQSLINELESGKRRDTTTTTAKRLARALGVSIDALVGTFDTEGPSLTMRADH